MKFKAIKATWKRHLAHVLKEALPVSLGGVIGDMHREGKDIDDGVNQACQGASDHLAKGGGEGSRDPLGHLLDRLDDGVDYLLEKLRNLLKQLLEPAGALYQKVPSNLGMSFNSVILPAGALGSGGGRELERGGSSRTGQKC